MDLNEYLLVRRKTGPLLREEPRETRISFEELAILCHLAASGPLRSSDLATYEGVIRPTMSHRLLRLQRLLLVAKVSDEPGRRSIPYVATRQGLWRLADVLEAFALSVVVPDPLAKASPERLGRYVEAAGTIPTSAADLVILSLVREGRPLYVTEIQRRTGLLQPTCSMALVNLAGRGLVERPLPETDATTGQGEPDPDASPRSAAAPAALTHSGELLGRGLSQRVDDAVVHHGGIDISRAESEGMDGEIHG